MGRRLDTRPEAIIQRIRDALRGLEFGEVRIVVHDRQVVRLERNERIRVDVVVNDTGNDPGLNGGDEMRC